MSPTSIERINTAIALIFIAMAVFLPITVSASMPEIEDRPESASCDGIWAIYGGRWKFYELGNTDALAGVNQRKADDFWAYDPYTDTWEELADVPEDAENVGNMELIQKDHGILVFSYDDGDAWNYWYSIPQNTWLRADYPGDFNELPSDPLMWIECITPATQVDDNTWINVDDEIHVCNWTVGGTPNYHQTGYGSYLLTTIDGVDLSTEWTSTTFSGNDYHSAIYTADDHKYWFFSEADGNDPVLWVDRYTKEHGFIAQPTTLSPVRWMCKPDAVVDIDGTRYIGAFVRNNVAGGNTINGAQWWWFDRSSGSWTQHSVTFDTANTSNEHSNQTAGKLIYINGGYRYYYVNPIDDASLKGYYVDLSNFTVDVDPTTLTTATRPANDSCSTYDQDGYVSSISWITPRCAFDTESLIFEIHGSVNMTMNLQLLGSDGTLLDYSEACMPDNGVYYWESEVGTSYEGFLYCYELNTQIRSTYGYVSDAPSSTTLGYGDLTYAENFDHSAAYEVEDYHIGETDLLKLFYHEDRSIPFTATLTGYDVSVFHNFDSSVVWTDTLSDLATDYYSLSTTYTANNDMLHTRYVLAVMDSLDDTYDDLIIELGRPKYEQYYGTYGLSLSLDDAVLTEAYTMYIYGLTSQAPVDFSVDKDYYSPRGAIKAALSIAEDSGIFEQTDKAYITIYDEDDEVIWRLNSGSGTAISDYTTEFNTIAPSSLGYYSVVCVLSNDTTGWTLRLTDTFDVTQGGTSDDREMIHTSGVQEGLEWIADSLGIPYSVGKMILILLAIIITVFWLRSWPVAAAVCSLGWIGVGIFSGWWPTWLVIILAVAFGLTVFRFITGISHGRGAD